MLKEPNRRGFLRKAAALGGALGAAEALAESLSAQRGPFRGKLSICNETFGGWPWERVCRTAAECGYQGVEIAPFTISSDVTKSPPKQRRAIRRQAENAGVRVVGLHWLLSRTKGLHLTSRSAAVRRRTADYLGGLVSFCADVGGEVLVFGSPRQRDLPEGVDRAEGMKYAAEVFRKTIPALEAAGVRLAVEPLSPRTTNFLRTAADAVELIKMVDSPRCRLILDCLAMSTEPTPIPELIRRYRSYLIHFHANDPNRQGPGFGKLDFHPIFQALRDIDYDGWISVEVFDYSPGAERLARESINYMKRVIQETR